MRKLLAVLAVSAFAGAPFSSLADGVEHGHATPKAHICTGGVSGTAFVDANGNGVRDAGEPALGGATVTLERTGTGLPAYGTLKRSSNFTTMSTNNFNGRGIAYDGASYWITHTGEMLIRKLNPATLQGVASYSTAPWTPQALSFDAGRKRIWAVGDKLNAAHTDYEWRIWGVNPTTGLEIPGSTVPVPSQLTSPDGLQHDPRTDSFWLSNDSASKVYHVSMAGAVIGSFTVPFAPFGNSGIGFDGCHLWLGLVENSGWPIKNRFAMVSDLGTPLSYFVPGPLPLLNGEDIEIDDTSAAPDVLLWSHSAGSAADRLQAWSIARATRTTQTDAQGNYTFSQVEPGQYQVKQTLYTGYNFTLPSGGLRTVTVTASILPSQNFGNK